MKELKESKQFWVSVYEKFSKYEPAEGGYFYDCMSLERSTKRYKNYCDALNAFNLMKNNFILAGYEIGFDTENEVFLNSNDYEVLYVCVENRKGKHASGTYIYC